MTIELLNSKIESNDKQKNYVRSGIAIPFQHDGQGKILLARNKELDEQGILINLIDVENENAFMQIYNVTNLVFQRTSEGIKAVIEKRVQDVMKIFENQNRMTLVENSIEIQQYQGFVYVSFKYMNMETETTHSIALKGTI